VGGNGSSPGRAPHSSTARPEVDGRGGGDQHRAASTMVKETGVESVAPVGEDLEFWDESEMTRKAGYYL
jgi:hypothetical protein